MSARKAVFVTGTDTGVGKTTVAVALVGAWVRAGRRVAVMKPIETGCVSTGGALFPADGERLRAATGRRLDLGLVCPFRYRTPAAPEMAAQLDPAPLPVLEDITAAYERLASDADVVLVEGAGGLLVPISGRTSMADLPLRLGLPVLLVARTTLGTINHTLLTIEALRRRGLRLAGVILNQVSPSPGPEEFLLPESLARHGGVPVLGTLPYGPDPLDQETLANLAAEHLALSTLWDAL